MALDATIEGAAADTYATVAEFTDYCDSMGLSVSSSLTAVEGNLRRARLALDRGYSWKGYPTTDAQSLAFPRVIGDYVEGYAVPSDTIPQRIKDAQCELAYLIQGGADPFATLTGGKVESKTERVDVISESTTYASGTARDRAAYPAVDQLVAPYAHGKAGQSGSMRVIRA